MSEVGYMAHWGKMLHTSVLSISLQSATAYSKNKSHRNDGTNAIYYPETGTAVKADSFFSSQKIILLS